MSSLTGRAARGLSVAIALLAIGSDALAQSGQRGTMIIGNDQGRHVLHYAEPDLDLVLQPDLRPSDIRIFDKELKLSDAQREVIERLLEEYLEAYKELLDTQHPEHPEAEEATAAPKRRQADGEPAEGAPAAAGSPRDEENAINAIILDELRKAGFDAASLEDLPFSPRISIGVSMPAPDAEGGGAGPLPPEPSLDVSISFESEDDVLTDELRAKLQAAADKMVPRITEHTRAQMAAQMEAGGGMGGGRDPAEAIRQKWQELTDLRARIKAFLAAKRTLRARVMAEVQTILAEEQLALWPAFERTLTRIKTLPLGTFDGESTDLLAILDDLDLSETALEKIAPLLESYELQLHAALVRRNELLEDVDAEIDLALYERDGNRALMLVDRATRARIAIRRLNEQYREMITGELSHPHAAAFRRSALAAAYPTVYRRTLGEEAFAQALQLDSISGDVRAAITTLHADYLQQLGRINDRIVRTIRDQQPRRLRKAIEQAVAELTAVEFPGKRSEARDTITDDFRRRRQLDARTMRSLYALLTPGQIAKLPKIPEIDPAEPVTAEHSEGGPDEQDY